MIRSCKISQKVRCRSIYYNCVVSRVVLCRWYSDMWEMCIFVVQDAGHHQDEHGSIFVNEAAFMSPSLNNRHIHLQHHPHHHHQTVRLHSGSIGFSDSPSAQNSLNSLLARSNHRQSSAGVSDAPAGHESWTGGTMYSTPLRSLTESPNDGNVFTAITCYLVGVGSMSSLMSQYEYFVSYFCWTFSSPV